MTIFKIFSNSLRFMLKSSGSPNLKYLSFSINNSNMDTKRILGLSCKSDINCQYEEAVEALNGLQSNADVLKKIRSSQSRKDHCNLNLKLTQLYLERLGISLSDLDKLSVIHVAGTKGKGSTCAFVESLLREQGFKTGFFSSPHLIAVRERIRINSRPISKKEFTYHFWNVYNALGSLKEDESDMPAYFKFLTILAFNIFLQEDVDVAIIEVGLGGECDCTNILRKPVVCGITSLDLDHTSIIGNTIEEIAWNKAGIIKPGVPALTVREQPTLALKVLHARAKEKGSELHIVPPLENYGWGGSPIHLGLGGYVQFLNASLALQLSRYWLENADQSLTQNTQLGLPFELSEEEKSGLANVVWPGRSQVLEMGCITFFLDGAHTSSSIQNCLEWFEKTSMQLSGSRKVCRISVFNLTGDRDGEAMLRPFLFHRFHYMTFTTNLVSREMKASSDQKNNTVSEASQIDRCWELKNTWTHLQPSRTTNEVTSGQCLTFDCIKAALDWISLPEASNSSFPDKDLRLGQLIEADCVHVLVTGSLHLVGGFLSVLDPALSIPSRGIPRHLNSIVGIVKRGYHSKEPSLLGSP